MWYYKDLVKYVALNQNFSFYAALHVIIVLVYNILELNIYICQYNIYKWIATKVNRFINFKHVYSVNM